MSYKIAIAKEDLEKITSVEATLCRTKDVLIFNGKEAVTTDCHPIYAGFADTAAQLVTSAQGVSYFVTIQESNKEEVHWVSISRNALTETLFDPFKRLGVYLSNFKCGICYSTGTLYTSAKFRKELERASDAIRANLYAYVYSIVTFIKNYQSSNGTLSVGDLGKLDTGMDYVDFVQCIPMIPQEDLVCYIEDTYSVDLKSIKYFHSKASKLENNYSPAVPIQCALGTREDAAIAVVVVPIASRNYTFVIGANRQIYTDYELCTLELSSDSLCNYIAYAYLNDVHMVHVSTEHLKCAAPYTPVDLESFEEVKNDLPAHLAIWCNNMLQANVTGMSDSCLKHLSNIGVFETDSIQIFDSDSVKKSYDNDAYAQELYKQVKPYYSTFDLKNVEHNIKGFATGAIYAMVFIGESGTGKSTAARVLPTRCGLPYISVNFSVNIEEADLFGSLMPNPTKACADDPEFVWQDGIITRAVRNGYCVILEEINFARPGVLGKLNSLLDENRQIDLSTGEIVRAHPNFRIIATCNIAYEGTNRFNKALINRFDDVTMFVDLDRAEAIKVIKERTGYSNATKISKIYDVYEAIKKFSAEQRIHTVVSMRQLLNMFTKGRFYKDAKDAVMRIMLNGAFVEDYEYQLTFEETVLPAFDLKFKI